MYTRDCENPSQGYVRELTFLTHPINSVSMCAFQMKSHRNLGRFDTEERLNVHLKNNPCDRDRVGRVDGVRCDTAHSQVQSVFFVLQGIAQFVNCFENIKKRPNAKLVYDSTKGFNEGCLSVVACTPNRAGIGAGVEILIGYGVGFDLQVKIDKSEEFQGRMKGPLERFAISFSPAGKRKAPAELPVQEPSKKSASSVGDPSGPSAAGNAAGCQDAGASVGSQPGAAGAFVGPEPDGADTFVGQPPGDAEPTSKSMKTEESIYKFSKPFEFHFISKSAVVPNGPVQQRYFFRSLFTANKEIPKYFFLEKILDGELVPKSDSGDVFPWKVTPKSYVVDNRTDEVWELCKLVKDQYPKTMSLFGYGALEKPGQVKGELIAERNWGVQLPPSKASLLHSLKHLSSVQPCFIVKFDEAKKELQPFGIVVVSLKEKTVKPGEDLVAE